jgi:hypothetical protein
VKYHENPKFPPPTTSLLAVYSASTKKLIDKKSSPFIPLSESKRILNNSLRCPRYHDFRDTHISTHFSGILFGVADCRICDFAPTPSLFPLFPMYQVLSVSIYKALIHRKQVKSEGVDRKGGEKYIWQSAKPNKMSEKCAEIKKKRSMVLCGTHI